MHIEYFVEEQSAARVVTTLTPKILGDQVTCRVHAFQGKHDLLASLQNRMSSMRDSMKHNADWRIVVLVDCDNDDCMKLKKKLESTAQKSGLTTRTLVTDGARFQVINRIAVEELEAWFLGDITAIVQAYPRVSPHLARRSGFRDPDQIRGGTWEALERILQKAGYYTAGLPKIEVARTISGHMEPQRNRSGSFQCFVAGLRGLL